MGNWLLHIEGGPSGHNAAAGDKKYPGNADYEAAQLVKRLRDANVPIKSAVFVHWPGQADSVAEAL